MRAGRPSLNSYHFRVGNLRRHDFLKGQGIEGEKGRSRYLLTGSSLALSLLFLSSLSLTCIVPLLYGAMSAAVEAYYIVRPRSRLVLTSQGNEWSFPQ
jgi:hypothetical protein